MESFGNGAVLHFRNGCAILMLLERRYRTENRNVYGGERMHLLESGEMYLETILILTKQKDFVRSLDVAEYMNYSKPSVSRAVGLLKNGGYIRVDGDGYITLTAEGHEIADKIYERHTVLAEFLTKLGVDPKIAVQDACKIEHDISDESFDAIKKHATSGKLPKKD